MSKVDWQEVARRQSNRTLGVITIACLYGGWFFAVWADREAASHFEAYADWRDFFWFWVGQWIWILGALAVGRVIHSLVFWGIESAPGAD